MLSSTLTDVHPLVTDEVMHRSFVQPLRSSYMLCDISADGIRAALSETDRLVSELDEEITRLKPRLNEAIHSRNRLERYATSIRALVSPANRLPVELWEQIFLECLPAEGWARPSVKEAPLVLCQVCSGWRNLAISSPRLWSFLAVMTTARFERPVEEQKSKAMMELWAHRSAAHPFSMSLTADAQIPLYRTPRSRLAPIWKTLLSHSSHWRCLDIRVPESSLGPLLASGVHDFPMLETLNIDASPETLAQRPSFSLERAPRLRNVNFSHMTFDIRLLKINYAQLTEITVLPQSRSRAEVFFTLDECLDILAHGTCLIKCTFSVEDVMPSRADLVVSVVQEFCLSFRDSDRRAELRGVQPARITRLGRFFDLLQMPVLRNLTIGDFVGNFADSDSWPLQHFLSYLARSEPPLNTLHLVYVPLFETEVVECLRLVSSLTSLVVETRQCTSSQRAVGDTLLQALSINTSSSRLVPGLKSIDFRHCGKRCTEPVIIDFLDSRRRTPGITLLESFKMQVSSILSDELTNRIIQWSTQGMEVELRC